MRFTAYQDISDEELTALGLSRDEVEKTAVLVSGGRRFRGAAAANAILWSMPAWRPLVILIHLIPVLLLFEHLGYRLVARHRGRISRALGLACCRDPV